MDFQLPPFDIEKYQAELSNVTEELQKPDVLQDHRQLAKLSSRHHELTQLIHSWQNVNHLLQRYQEAQELSSDADPEITELAQQEILQLTPLLQQEISTLNKAALPPLPHDEAGAIMEIRAGTGGTEAALFAEEINRMYLRYLQSQHLPAELVNIHYNDDGGIKEAILLIDSPGTFGKLRFESGVHRVQRVPTTEASGRIHTSAISVVVLPYTEAKDIHIDPSELRIEVFRASGPGGQSVNTTDSAVRITHIPSGITVSCQDSKSQHKNKERALSILASKLETLQRASEQAEADALRENAIQSGDRSAKIRTYNFPQGRITDHRIQQSWFSLNEALEGDIDEIISTVSLKLRESIS